MTANEIRKKSLILFVEKGYEGTSLADIGEAVGIKKQSVYSHFKSKDDIFLQVMKQVIQEEISFLNDFFNSHKSDQLYLTLYQFVSQFKERYLSEKEMNPKFMLKMMFIPPNHLQQTTITSFWSYFCKMEELLKEIFEEHKDELDVSPEEALISFLNFIDGLLVELIYVNVEKFEQRLKVSWKIYWKGITK